MRLKLLALPTILALSSCGPHAPAVDDCTIDPTGLSCIKAHPQAKQPSYYHLTPLEAYGDLCLSTGDFLVEKLYTLTLEDNLVACNKAAVLKPRVDDCAVDGKDTVTNSLVVCSDGVSTNVLSWAQAERFLCVSTADFEILRNYQNSLIQGIANCP